MEVREGTIQSQETLSEQRASLCRALATHLLAVRCPVLAIATVPSTLHERVGKLDFGKCSVLQVFCFTSVLSQLIIRSPQGEPEKNSATSPSPTCALRGAAGTRSSAIFFSAGPPLPPALPLAALRGSGDLGKNAWFFFGLTHHWIFFGLVFFY